MQLLDDEGRLFGTVNVVDAVVVLIAVAVLAAAGAVVFGSSSEAPSEPTYVTFVSNEQPEGVADQVAEGDTLGCNGGRINVTDLHRTAGADGSVIVLQGEVTAKSTNFRAGMRCLLSGDQYVLNGTVRHVDNVTSKLSVSTRPVRMVAVVDQGTAGALEANQSMSVARDRIATITHVSSIPIAGTDDRRLELGAQIKTFNLGNRSLFGDRSLVVGRTISIETATARIDGRLTAVDSDTPRGDPVNASIEVVWESVRPTLAASLMEGMAEDHRGSDATITDVETRPATVLVQNGSQLVEREHPSSVDVVLTVEVAARESDDRLRFHGERLRLGTDLVLEFEPVVVEGTVVDIDHDD